MPTVFIPAPLQSLTGGRSTVEAEGATVREVIASLDRAWPGLRDRIVDGDRLRPNISVAVDGVVSPLGLIEKVPPDAEVHFVAAIRGGAGARSVLSNAVAILLVLFATERALACSCGSDPPPCERYGEASVVFFGQVLHPPPDESNSLGVRVRVDEAFKGLEPGERHVVLNDDVIGTSCDGSYKPGQWFVFFAWRTSRGFKTSLCSGTFSVYGPADPRVAGIRQLARGETATRIYGVLKANTEQWRMRWSSAPGIDGAELTAIAESGKTYKARSSDKGEYEFPAVEPGRYRMKVRHQTHRSRDPVYTAEVRQSGCAEVDIAMWDRPKLTGRLTGPDGRPLAGVEVELIASRNPWGRGYENSFEERVITDEDGRFFFYEASSGTYALALNATRDPSPSRPFPPTYFPGTEKAEEAEQVFIPRADARAAAFPPPHDFEIARKLSPRTIRLRAVDESGAALGGVRVRTLWRGDDRGHPYGLTTAANGEASFQGFQEVTHQLFLTTDKLYAHVSIPPGKDSAEVTVILKPPPPKRP